MLFVCSHDGGGMGAVRRIITLPNLNVSVVVFVVGKEASVYNFKAYLSYVALPRSRIFLDTSRILSDTRMKREYREFLVGEGRGCGARKDIAATTILFQPSSSSSSSSSPSYITPPTPSWIQSYP
jgi:hypothetical protein